MIKTWLVDLFIKPLFGSQFLADCSDLLQYGGTWATGVYEAETWNSSTKTLLFCDMATKGGGWTVSSVFVVVVDDDVYTEYYLYIYRYAKTWIIK